MFNTGTSPSPREIPARHAAWFTSNALPSDRAHPDERNASVETEAHVQSKFIKKGSCQGNIPSQSMASVPGWSVVSQTETPFSRMRQEYQIRFSRIQKGAPLLRRGKSTVPPYQHVNTISLPTLELHHHDLERWTIVMAPPGVTVFGTCYPDR